MNTNKKLIVLIISLTYLASFSQNEIYGPYKNWEFGGIRLTFENQDSVTSMQTGSDSLFPYFRSYESTATVSDEDGNFLFYTNGRSVFNKDLDFIPGGNNTLKAGDEGGYMQMSSSVQGSMIVKHSESDLYYIFTVGDAISGYADGIQYVSVDMSANNGVGQVSSSIKIGNNVSEALTAGIHSNGKDIWIVTHLNTTEGTRIGAYLLTKDSVTTSPIISEVEGTLPLPIPGAGLNYSRCSMQFNSTGIKLISFGPSHSASSSGGALFFDFNNSTGKITRKRKLLFGDYQNISGTNHVAFSPLENYLFYRNPYGTLCRLNISNWENMDSIANSFKLFETSMNSRSSAGMKFGPNKKLYVNAGDITEYEGNWDEENLIITESAKYSNYFSSTWGMISGAPNMFVPKLNSQISKYIVIDSVYEKICETRYLRVSLINGVEPFTYEWDDDSLQNQSYISSDQGGLHKVKITDSSGGVFLKHFYLKGPVQDVDLPIYNLSAGAFRPGRETSINLKSYGLSCNEFSGEVSLEFDPSLLTLVTTVLVPEMEEPGKATWNFNNINMNNVWPGSILKFKVSESAQISDTVCFNLQVKFSVHDSLSINLNYCYPVINSYDPNDKQVSPQGTCEDKFVTLDQNLTYTVRYQNTGNASAIDIAVYDTISSSLDLSSIHVLDKSFEGTEIEILEDSILVFKMDSIMLPDSTSDEEGSKGFVTFLIPPKENIQNNTVVENRVGIYFDFNPVVLTNSVKNTFVTSVPYCGVTGANRELKNNMLTIFPNPFEDSFTIRTQETNYSGTVINSLGQPVIKFEYPLNQINTSKLESGVYYIQFESVSDSYTLPVIKR